LKQKKGPIKKKLKGKKKKKSHQVKYDGHQPTSSWMEDRRSSIYDLVMKI
jgi:hypothetical protein